ncbi:SPEG neighbor protein-like [Ciona intestinalis]
MPARRPPPGVDINLDDKDVQSAACMIQKSFRGHRVRKKLSEDGPPKFLDELCDISMVEGSAARIDGRLGGFPDPTVTWYKDGQEIKEGPKYNIIFEEPDVCALVIRNTEADDVGTYTCKAFNNFGEAFDSAKININVPAKIEKGPPNQSCKNGCCITMKATISGNPEPMVGWAKDGEDIDEDDHIFYDIDNDTTVLTIKNCTKKDAGKYEVYVENDQGFDHSFSRIEVK